MKSVAERREAITSAYPKWTPCTIAQHFDLVASKYGNRDFLIGGNRSWTYSELQNWSRQLAAGLIKFGVEPGDRVALDMANYPEFVATKFGIALAGATCVPCNFLLRGSELEYVLEQSGSKVLVTMDTFRGHDYLAELRRPNSLKTVIVFRTGDGESASAHSDGVPFEELSSAFSAEHASEVDRRSEMGSGSDLSDIIYTSGTTGRSKGVMLTHDMILRAAYSSALTRAFEDGRRILYAMPMYHVFGYVECMIAATFVGGAAIPQVVFDPVEMLELAEHHRASEIVCVPVMTMKLIEAARERGFASSHLQTVFNSGGVNPPSIWGEIDNILRPKETVTAYGMTETTASTTCTLPEDAQYRLLTSNGGYKIAGVSGDPAIGGLVAEYKAIDPVTGEDLPPGEEGELVTRGPIVTEGYYNKPEVTAGSFTADGWLHTGDLGRIGADGYLVLTGRIKETYRCNGEMVMPKEIEDLFADHPDVEQALVVGVPDLRAGEAGCLCIVPKEGRGPDPERLVAFCARNLAGFKVPKHVLFLELKDIPLTPTGRPQKFKLARLASERLEARQEA